jgi:hypothetical protein
LENSVIYFENPNDFGQVTSKSLGLFKMSTVPDSISWDELMYLLISKSPHCPPEQQQRMMQNWQAFKNCPEASSDYSKATEEEQCS